MVTFGSIFRINNVSTNSLYAKKDKKDHFTSSKHLHQPNG